MELTWPRVISGGFALVCATAYGVWELRGDRIEHNRETIAAYQKAQDWKLGETIAALNTASERISARIKELSEIEDIKPRLERALRQIRTQEKDYVELANKLNKAESFIRNIYPLRLSFTLSEGESKHLVGHELVVGLVKSSSVTNYVDIIVENKKERLSTGQSYMYSVENKHCRLIFNKNGYNAASGNWAEFSFICRNKA